MSKAKQPPPRGCVLKLHFQNHFPNYLNMQPPSGGCVLKLEQI